MEKTVCFGCGEKYIPNQLTHDEIFLRLALDMSDDPHCDKDKIWHESLKKSLLEIRKNGEIIKKELSRLQSKPNFWRIFY